jgi:hypothetical protein
MEIDHPDETRRSRRREGIRRVNRGNNTTCILMLASISSCTIGCAMNLFDGSTVWWASVTSAVQQAEVPPHVDRRCVRVPEGTGGANDGTVAIVRYRVGRARFTQALTLAERQKLHVGDRVTVHSPLCKINLNSGSGT